MWLWLPEGRCRFRLLLPRHAVIFNRGSMTESLEGTLVVYLPQGSVGLELEAVSRCRGGAKQMTGCRVRGWSRESALTRRVTRGSVVLGERSLIQRASLTDPQPLTIGRWRRSPSTLS